MLMMSCWKNLNGLVDRAIVRAYRASMVHHERYSLTVCHVLSFVFLSMVHQWKSLESLERTESWEMKKEQRNFTIATTFGCNSATCYSSTHVDILCLIVLRNIFGGQWILPTDRLDVVMSATDNNGQFATSMNVLNLFVNGDD
jgi:hypothetical protein